MEKMDEKKKKKLIRCAIAFLVIVVFLNIPIVSDVIAVARVGLLDDVVKIEKVEYEGETHNLFLLDERGNPGTPSNNVCYVTENSVFRATVRYWEYESGLMGYLNKPLFGPLGQLGAGVPFTPGEEPQIDK